MPSIPDAAVEQVRASVDLVDVVSDHVRLKKQGSRFVGLCPFHNEKTPSFSVDPNQDLFYCFGCKKGGDLYKFVQEIEGVGFLDSVRLLADRAGIVLPEEDAPREGQDARDTMHAALRFAAKFYFEQLKSPTGTRALDYLLERGFAKETITAFGIGYASASWDGLLKAATEAQFKPDVLEAVGLVKGRSGGDGHYDVFRDRVMFPILDRMGKVLGFGGRILPDSPTASADYTPAKYINTPETPVYHKSEVLYGLKQAKTALRAEEEALLVEGYADVISLHQVGIKNVVASSGTALTPQQVRALSKAVKTVVLLYDADAAGLNAALKGIDIVLAGSLAPYVVALPDGADPDSFVQQFGAEAFRTVLREERQDFVGFIVAQARRAGRLDTGEGKGETVDRVLASVALVQNVGAREHYLQRAAEALGIPDMELRPLLKKQGTSRRRLAPPMPPAAPPNARPADGPPGEQVAASTAESVMLPEESELLRLMLEHDVPMIEHVLLRMALDEFSEGVVRKTVGHIIAQYEADTFDADAFLRGDFGEAVQRLAAEVLSERYAVSDRAEERGLKKVMRDAKPFEAAEKAMRLLKLDRVDEALAAAKRRIFQAEQAGDDLAPLQTALQDLLALRKQIESGAFMEWGAKAE